jgi:pilus assembly protein Flp/PilA
MGKRTMLTLLAQEHGQGLVEYALIILLVALVAFGALGLVGTALGEFFQSVADLDVWL